MKLSLFHAQEKGGNLCNFLRGDMKFQENLINDCDNEKIYPCSLSRKFKNTMEQLLAKYELLTTNIRGVRMAKVGHFS